MTEHNQQPFTAAAFYEYLGEKKLMASRCIDSGALYIPPREICPQTFSENMEWVGLSGKGTLAAFTTVHIVPTAMEQDGFGRKNPYCTGIVALEEGVKISARILGVDAQDPASIEIGAPVEVEFLERGEGDGAEVLLGFRVAGRGD